MGFAQDWRETPSLCRGHLLLGARPFLRYPHGNTSSFPRRIFLRPGFASLLRSPE
jgi:hypothetical protein